MAMPLSNLKTAFRDVPFYSQQKSLQSKLAAGCVNGARLLSRPLYAVSEAVIRAIVTPLRGDDYGNLRCLVAEIFRRCIVVAAGIFTAPMTAGLYLNAAALDYCANKLTHRPFMYKPGQGQENNQKSFSLLTCNCCMFWGCLPRLFGGVRPATVRCAELADKIKEQAPDVVVLQEVVYDSACMLYERLKGEYSHFFMRIGSHPLQLESGLFIASRLPIIDGSVQFAAFPSPKGIKRGLFYFETPQGWILATHLQSGQNKGDVDIRRQQLEGIVTTMEKLKQQSAKPCFLAGDFNIARVNKSEYQAAGIDSHFYDAYCAQFPKAIAVTATATDSLNDYMRGRKIPLPDKKWESIDYALVDADAHKNGRVDVTVAKIPMYDLESPAKALSDHHALLLTSTLR